MTQRPKSRGPLPAKDSSTLSAPLHNQQSASLSKHKPGTVFSSRSSSAGARSGAQRLL